MDIGKRVRNAREERGITQEELARRAGVPLNRVGRIETGTVTDPHYSTLTRIAGGLGVSVSELLEEPALAGKAEAPKRGAQPHSGPAPITTKDVVYAIDMMVGLRAETPRYVTKWAKHLENLVEGGQLPEQSEREVMLVANTMQDEFMRSFETIGQAALAEGRSTPYEWPQNIKDLVLEAGAHVQAATETAQRISEECARRSNARETALAEEFFVGRMPEELTRDPAWGEALEEARAVR